MGGYLIFAPDWKTRMFLGAHPHNNANVHLTPRQAMIRWIKSEHYANHSGKYYLSIDAGVLIIPEDFSYTQFISNTWYEDEYKT